MTQIQQSNSMLSGENSITQSDDTYFTYVNHVLEKCREGAEIIDGIYHKCHLIVTYIPPKRDCEKWSPFSMFKRTYNLLLADKNSELVKRISRI